MGFDLGNIQTTSKQPKTNSKSGLESFLQKEITWFQSSFSNKFKEAFYTELSVLLTAGVTLKESLTLLKENQKKKQLQLFFEDLTAHLINGRSFSDALKTNKTFTEYEYYSLKIGEETGTLANITASLGDFYKRKNNQRRIVVSALTYPIIIISTAILVVVFMLHFVVPMFEDIFLQNKVELPSITKFIINCSKLMASYGWLFVLLLLLPFLLRSLFIKKQWYQEQKDRSLQKMPILGKFITTVYLSQFTGAMELLTASKVPITNSIMLVKKMVVFKPLQKALDTVEHTILEGKDLSTGLSKSKLFDNKMIALVKVAEQTNQTEFIFKRLNEQYNNQVEQQSKLMTTLLEPLIILFVGILVAVILIAMYLPMFKLSSVLG